MTRTANVPDLTLADGHVMPQLGLGVWQVPHDETASVVRTAIDLGYRHVDTARIYDNERGVGAGVRASGVPREELFVTTKLWNSDQGYDEARRALQRSLELLDMEYVDLFLIHWPAPAQDRYVDSWRALVQLRKDGLVRSIGVSNFHAEHLERVIDATGVVPAVNQVELHPWLQQRELRAVHERLGIVTEDWSPLGQGGGLLEDATIVEIAQAHDATPAQVVLAWHLAIGSVVIPKSVHAARIAENLAAARLQLTEAEVARIDALDRGNDGRIGPDPETANF